MDRGEYKKMNYILENIKSRRSVRSYLDQKVPKRLIEEVLEAGRSAPSALNKQPWEFVVVTNKALIEKLSLSTRKTAKKVYALLPFLKLFKPDLRDERTIAAIRKTAGTDHDTVFYNAPAIIFIVSRHSDGWVPIDCALAAQNMMLSAHSLGLGSCFIGRASMLSRDRRLLKKIGIRRGYRIYTTLIFGYPKEFPKTTPQRRKDNLICWKD